VVEDARLKPFAVRLDQAPIEGLGNVRSGVLTWKTLISGDRTASNEMTVGVAEFPPHGVFYRHHHAPAEFYFGLSGDGIVTANGVPMEISQGVAVYIPGNTEHGVVAGTSGLSFLYGFACRTFSEIIYHYSDALTLPPG
jgi:quercetin dioxygenase-like cupin family protein